MAPLILGAANVLNANPREGSKLSMAFMSPILPALTSSSNSASTRVERMTCRATW